MRLITITVIGSSHEAQPAPFRRQAQRTRRWVPALTGIVMGAA